MRKLRVVSLILFFITLSIAGIHIFIFPLSDWIIRINGIVMLLDIAAVSFSTGKMIIAGKRGN